MEIWQQTILNDIRQKIHVFVFFFVERAVLRRSHYARRFSAAQLVVFFDIGFFLSWACIVV